jgi:hypothetical protein
LVEGIQNSFVHLLLLFTQVVHRIFFKLQTVNLFN